MATPTRMPRYEIKNEGGVFVSFYCENCGREARSQPTSPANIVEDLSKQAVGSLLGRVPIIGDALSSGAQTTPAVTQQDILNSVTGGIMQQAGGLLGRIPVIGDALAQSMVTAGQAHASALSAQQLEMAWSQVQSNFQECPTCHKIVCLSDFDMQTGLCSVDSASSQAAAPAAATTPADSTTSVACPNCSTAVQGAKFCPNCGAKIEAPARTTCPNCGKEAHGAKFCPDCGARIN